MLEESFTLEYVYTKDCFLYFSDKWLRKLNNSKFSGLKLSCRTHEYYFTWGSRPVRLNDCTVGINATFAQGLDLKENDIVMVKAIETVPPLQKVFMSPITQDDYEILDLSRDHVERSLLNQVQIIFTKQILTIWVSKSMKLKLQVDELESKKIVGRLQPFTELVIASYSAEHHVTKSEKSLRPNQNNGAAVVDNYQNRDRDSSIWGTFSHYLHKNVLGISSNTNIEKNLTEEDDFSNSSSNLPYIFRVHPLLNDEQNKGCCKDVHNPIKNPYNVFTHCKSLPDWCLESSNERVPLLCTLSVVPFHKKKSEKISSDSEAESNKSDSDKSKSCETSNTVCVRLYSISCTCKTFSIEFTQTSFIFVSSTIRNFLKLSVGSKVKLTQYKPELDHLLFEVYLKPFGKNDGDEKSDDIIERFTQNLSEGSSHLLNNHAPFPFLHSNGSIDCVQVILHSEQLKCWPLTRAELQVCPITLLPEDESDMVECFTDPYFSENGHPKEKTEYFRNKLKSYSDVFEEAIISLQLDLGLSSQYLGLPFKYNILITGKHGSGKTTMANHICNYFNRYPHFVHIVKLDCKQLYNKTVDSVSKTLIISLTECMYFQPSILVLDDLDVIAGVVKDTTDVLGKASQCSRVADSLRQLLHDIQNSCISVVATSVSHMGVNDQLISARGCHSFTTILSIPPLNKDDRLLILKELFQSNQNLIDSQGVIDNLKTIALKTEGYVERDLTSLVEKTIFLAMMRSEDAADDNRYTIFMDDIEKVLEGTVPYDLINVNLTRGSDCTFETVGGLTEAKRTLTEALIWPSKYAEVFETCPLRNERGVLLYGLPGTGKTLLAKAVAGECGFNFISVKGPELLSKYIGASEEAVRNIFQKAQNAKPCILFFDEFDSLAPRRGHDNTGVTDRVVNQLLTNLDGVEFLEGVWVLASTSRPDLLDPALLRPGRIGTLVYCSLPDLNERVEILQKLSIKLQFTADVDLKAIAKKTENFTAPDLKAVLYTALTMEDKFSEEDLNTDHILSEKYYEKVDGPGPKTTLISQQMLLSALNVTQPYLQDSDRKLLLNIYEIFDARRTGSNGTVQIPAQQVTFA